MLVVQVIEKGGPFQAWHAGSELPIANLIGCWIDRLLSKSKRGRAPNSYSGVPTS